MTEFKEQYYNKIPEDFGFLLKGLGNKFRFKLSLLLMENGSLSLSRIVKFVNKSNSVVINHIRKLELAGIVQNYLKKTEKIKEYSFYKLTEYGNAIITNLIKSYNDYYEKTIITGHKILFSSKKEIPKDFEMLLKGISNRFRYALSMLLEEKGPLSFSKIAQITLKEKSLINNHLKKLEISGIIQKFLEKTDVTNDYSFYKITSYGNKIITDLIQTYNDYYENIIIKEEKSEIIKESFEALLFDAGCGTWALPNEKLLGWIEIFTKEITRIELKPSNNLKMRKFLNIKDVYNENKNIHSLDLLENNVNYIPFEFYSIIPEGDHPVNIEIIEITAYDKDFNELYNKQLKIEIIKPIVKLDVKNIQSTSNSGFFEIKISVLKGFQIEIPGIEFKVLNQNNQSVEVISKERDPIDLNQEIPPGIKQNNFIGEFKINNKGTFYFHFKIPYFDVIKNKYYTNEVNVKIEISENYEGNLNYIYDHSMLIAQT